MKFYNTIEQKGAAEFKDRGSKFIAYASPVQSVEDFKSFLKELKAQHAKAVHHCFAYRLGLDGNQYRVSDDGEPSGTAGRPVLGQIDSKQLTDTGIVVVRYFGGTLLGVPGLVNAYKTAASLVLQVVPVIQKPILKNFSLQFDYTQMNDIQTVIKQVNGMIIKQEAMLFCVVNVGVAINRVEEFLYRIENIRNVSIEKIL